MFNYIEGVVAELGGGFAVIDCGGVGFELNASQNTIAALKMGERARLYVREAVKEDAFDLYGFATRDEKRLFELLISVSGVGPKAALSILSASTSETLTMAILTGDEKALTVAPGIGKKIAQRVIYELRDKMAREPAAAAPSAGIGAAVPAGGGDRLTDAAAALSVLGYSSAEISAALRGVDASSLDTEGLIRAALKNMMK